MARQYETEEAMRNETLFEDKLQEECGIFGIAAAPELADPAVSAYQALFALQHRGQDSSGIAVTLDGDIQVHKDKGLVPDVFTQSILDSFHGARSAIGHVRQNVSDRGGLTNIQPLVVHHASGSLALCYNGKLVNSAALRAETENRGGIFQGTNDAEIISYVIVREHLRTNTLADAVLNAMHYLIGAYSLVVMDGSCLIAARDPNGFRPLCIGKVGNSIVFASESCAIEALGGTFLRDVEPGEVVVTAYGSGEIHSMHCDIRARSALCMFELIYFARQDSVVDGAAVSKVREKAGRVLARNSTVTGDIVIGVPDSGIVGAMGYAQESGIPYELGLMKNRYIQRTFIESRAWEREKSVRIKLNAISSCVKGKRVILVDDSIVRGTTCARIVRLLRDAGASEVHVKSTAPAFVYPCYFGTSLPAADQLAAFGRTEEEIADLIGADSVQYLRVEDLGEIASDLNIKFCDACFTGDYAVPVPKERAEQLRISHYQDNV
jgi:amidophosphoribosyltransferase